MRSTTRVRQPRLETVRRRVDRWRQTRRHGRAPLPARLWAAAEALVPEHGVYGTARALGLSYGALKRHVEDPDDQPRKSSPRFVELPRPSVGESCVIEIDGGGAIVRVRFDGVPLPEVAAFTRLVVGDARA